MVVPTPKTVPRSLSLFALTNSAVTFTRIPFEGSYIFVSPHILSSFMYFNPLIITTLSMFVFRSFLSGFLTSLRFLPFASLGFSTQKSCAVYVPSAAFVTRTLLLLPPRSVRYSPMMLSAFVFNVFCANVGSAIIIAQKSVTNNFFICCYFKFCAKIYLFLHKVTIFVQNFCANLVEFYRIVVIFFIMRAYSYIFKCFSMIDAV